MENNWHNLEPGEIFFKLKSRPGGLTEKTALHRLEKYGHNKLPEAKTDSLAIIFLRQFQSPLIYILLFASIIVFFMQETIDAYIIIFVLVFNALVGTIQEGRARDTLAALKKFVSTNATVLREGREIIISDTEVVVGDIIIIQEGEKIPADARIISSYNLKVDESMLTGESKTISKNNIIIKGLKAPIAEQKNFLFKGTHIATGNGRAIVTATGTNTEIGKISKEVAAINKEIPLKKNLEYLSKVVAYSVVLFNFMLLFMGLALGKGFKEMFTTAISLSVSIIPEGLPIVMTLVLAVGVAKMSKKNVLVKKLQAVEALGQVDVIAVDKTGTLTKNEMVIEKIYTGGNIYTVLGSGYSPEGKIMDADKKTVKLQNAEIALAGRIAAFCSNANLSFLEKTKEWKVAGDPTEAALSVFAKKAGVNKETFLNDNPLLLDIPFDYAKKYQAAINQVSDKKKMISVIGAPEIVLNLIQTNKKNKEELENIFKKFSYQGYRVLGYAYKETGLAGTIELSSLIFGGFYCMKDALRPEVKRAVDIASSAGVRVVMITGDHKITAQTIAMEAGIYKDGDEIITGEELDRMHKDELAYRLKKISVFARVTPEHKLRIIKAFKQNKKIIAMTGDGVNDAPSLVAADVGVAMGKIGTEVAKEASDIILLNDDFGNIISGLKEGRSMYAAIKRVVLYLFSTNSGEVLTITMSVLLGLPLPLLAAQIIWLNLVSDSFLDVALSMEPKEKNITDEKFRKSQRHIIDRGMVLRIVLMSLPMTIGTLFIFSRYLPGLSDPLAMSKAWTMALTTMAVFHWMNAWNCRSETRSIFRSNPFSNKYLLAALAVVITLQLSAIYTPVMQKIMRTTALNIKDWLLILATCFSIIIVDEIRKFIISRKPAVRAS